MTDTTLYAQALACVQGWQDPAPEIDRLAELSTQLSPAGGRISAALSDAQLALDRALYGTASVDDILTAARTVQQLEADANIWSGLRSRVTQESIRAREDRALIEPDASAPAFEFLGARLDDLMTRVRDLDTTLGSIDSPTAALHAGGDVAEAWISLDAALTEYEQIRSAQLKIAEQVADLPYGFVGPQGTYHAHGHLRAALDLEHELTATWRRHPARAQGHSAQATPFYVWLHGPVHAPWKREIRQSFPDGDPHAYLRWLAVTEQAWVPSIDQAGHAIELVDTIVHVRDLRDALDAFDAYYTGRGLTPPDGVDTNEIRASLPARRGAVV